jgi:DNA-binding HxlR family transcriptional regulator
MANSTVYPRTASAGQRAYDKRAILPGVRQCPIADALDLVGDRWSLLVVREITMGAHRFSDIMRQTGIARARLSHRLRALEAEGIVVRQQYSQHPPRDEYFLSEAGAALTPVFRALAEWGRQYASD